MTATKPISASALKTYLGCPRRWAFRYLEGIEEPETEANTLGKKVHAELEQWIKLGKKPNHFLAMRVLSLYHGHPYFPGPGTTSAEEEFVLTISGVRWRGFTDGRRARQHEKARIVIDFKTTSDLKYALRPDRGVLLNDEGAPDVQASLYAAREFVEGATEVHGQWAYVATRGEGKRLVEVQFDRQHVEDVYAGMHLRAQEMQTLLQIRPKANDVPYRSSYCFAYRKPCPYAGSCQRPQGMFQSTPNDLISDEGANAMVDFLSKIRDSFPTATESKVEYDAPPPPPEDDEAPPPPPEDEVPIATILADLGVSRSEVECLEVIACEDLPPPPPADDLHAAEREVIDYLVSQGKDPAFAKRAVTGEVESGFINPPEAEGKMSYRSPEEAAAGEGVEPVVEKPKKGKGKGKKAKVVEANEPAPATPTELKILAAEKEKRENSIGDLEQQCRSELGEYGPRAVFESPKADIVEKSPMVDTATLGIEVAPGVFAEKGSIEETAFSDDQTPGLKSFEETVRDIVREEILNVLRSGLDRFTTKA